MREAVARAMDIALRAMESNARVSELTDDEVRALTDAAIRTVLERLREPTSAMVRAGGPHLWAGSRIEADAKAIDVWQAMLDAAVREVG